LHIYNFEIEQTYKLHATSSQNVTVHLLRNIYIVILPDGHPGLQLQIKQLYKIIVDVEMMFIYSQNIYATQQL